MTGFMPTALWIPHRPKIPSSPTQELKLWQLWEQADIHASHHLAERLRKDARESGGEPIFYGRCGRRPLHCARCNPCSRPLLLLRNQTSVGVQNGIHLGASAGCCNLRYAEAILEGSEPSGPHAWYGSVNHDRKRNSRFCLGFDNCCVVCLCCGCYEPQKCF